MKTSPNKIKDNQHIHHVIKKNINSKIDFFPEFYAIDKLDKELLGKFMQYEGN